MREKLQRFMMGRNGIDELNRFLMIVWFILWAIELFTKNGILSIFSFALLIYLYFRMFSRNLSKRYQENVAYLNMKNKITSKFRSKKSEMQQRKTHHIYKCPTCKQKLRVPRGRGNVEVRCRKCATVFRGRT